MFTIAIMLICSSAVRRLTNRVHNCNVDGCITDANVRRYLLMCRNAMSDEKQRERDRCKAMLAGTGDNDIQSFVNNDVKS